MVYTGNIAIDAILDMCTIADLKNAIEVKLSVNKPRQMTQTEIAENECNKWMWNTKKIFNKQ